MDDGVELCSRGAQGGFVGRVGFEAGSQDDQPAPGILERLLLALGRTGGRASWSVSAHRAPASR